MKKIALLFTFAIAAYNSGAQVTLSGTSYSQNFDLLGAGFPTGWRTYNNATSTSLGTLEALTSVAPGYPSMVSPDTVSCAGLVLGGGFKNFPSATVATPGDNWCGAPPTYSNRALGVRQVSPTNASHPDLDPGAAFCVQLANTTGLMGFDLTFKLQSLDTSSPRISTWKVDYGFGASPSSFTAASTGASVMTTGGKTFSNNTVNVDFGSALDNQSGPVWIRVVALSGSTGSGNRPSSAIDDFNLTWTSTTGVSNVPSQPVTTLTAIGQSTSDKITLAYTVEEAGIYTLALYDVAGRILHTQNVNGQIGTQDITVNGLHLAPGVYIAKINNGNSSSVARIAVQ